MKYTISLLLILLTYPANADEAFFKFGKSITNEPLPSSKVFGFGYQRDLPRGLILQSALGVVNTPGYSQKLAVTTGLSLGIEAKLGTTLALQGLWGPSYYSRKDQALGGPFQFTHDLCALGRDAYNTIGVCYQHVSSAGIHSPNRGLDSFQLRLGVRF